jgi:hypothetical protein
MAFSPSARVEWLPQSGRGMVLRNTKGAWALEYAPAPVSRVYARAVTSRGRLLAIGRSPPAVRTAPDAKARSVRAAALDM